MLNKSLFCKTGHAPRYCCFVTVTDLDLYFIDVQIDREHLLSMTNVFMKFEKAGPYQTLVTDRTRLYTSWTDQRTDRFKAVYTLFFERGIKIGVLQYEGYSLQEVNRILTKCIKFYQMIKFRSF